MASQHESTEAGPPRKKRKAIGLCHFKSTRRDKVFTVTVEGAEKAFSGEDLSGEDGAENVTCTACGVTFSVCQWANDVVKHFSTKTQCKAAWSKSKSTSATLGRFGFGQSEVARKARRKQKEHQLQVQQAEALFVQFIAEHNLPFRTGDHFTKLVKCIFTDSEIAKHFQCSRTKTSVLTRFGNGKYCHDQLIKQLTVETAVYFSLLVDESNDRGAEEKDLVVLLKFFDTSVMKAATRSIDLPTANDSRASAIFAIVDECLVSRGLKYEHLISFNSDTSNTMKGQRNGIMRYLRDMQPNVIDLECICHLENLAAKGTTKSLPIPIGSLLVDINTHFYLSVKRKEDLKKFCDFVNVTYRKVLTHVQTR